MDWRGALRARLLADGPLAALVGTRVYWIERPQTGPLPAVTLLTISDGHEQTLKELQGYQASRVQIDVWAANQPSAYAVAGAVIDAALPADTGNGQIFSRAMVDLPPRDMAERIGSTTVFRVSMDLIFHHAEDEEGS